MASFKCDACGHKYSDLGNYTVCPACSGFGKRDSKCTCPCFRGFSGTALNLRINVDGECPVHGRDAQKNKER